MLKGVTKRRGKVSVLGGISHPRGDERPFGQNTGVGARLRLREGIKGNRGQKKEVSICEKHRNSEKNNASSAASNFEKREKIRTPRGKKKTEKLERNENEEGSYSLFDAVFTFDRKKKKRNFTPRFREKKEEVSLVPATEGEGGLKEAKNVHPSPVFPICSRKRRENYRS